MRTPKQTIQLWVHSFNKADINALISLYSEDAVNSQVAYKEFRGRDEIKDLFSMEFSRAKMVCEIENLFEDGDWAILEWKDPLGLRGCGFFKVVNGLIEYQRGYFDKLSFFKAQGLPLEDALK